MNFLRGKSLKRLAFYLGSVLALLFVIEYLIIRYAVSDLNKAERRIDFARSVQLESQQLALQVQLFIQGNSNIAAEIASVLDQQDHKLKTLEEGGRIAGSNVFIDPLTRLPRITLNQLKESWGTYKNTINTIIVHTNEGPPIRLTSVSDSTMANSIQTVTAPASPPGSLSQARLTFESQWLSLSKWYDTLIIDLQEEVDDSQALVLNWFSFFVILNIGVLGITYYFFQKNVLHPLKVLEANAANAEFTVPENNEIGEVATKVNSTIEDLRDATTFVISIGEGKLDLDYKALNTSYVQGKNKLADSLIEMQSKLKSLNEEERTRQWVNEGLTRFVDILRSSNDDLGKLGDKIIAGLVQYTHSNQGAIYILNDDDANNKFLELISLFAFDIKKHEQRKIKLGEGILGQTFLEKETTYINDLPESYIRITSGLGDAPPRSVLMVPLKVDTMVYGILELASFHEIQKHEISFVEKLGESIAATLASVRSTQKNKQLIEQFQQQTEEMRAQEEEMRQNMEELQATQEEIARKEKNYVERIKQLEAQPLSDASSSELRELKIQVEKREAEYKSKIEELSRQLAVQPQRADDWQLAEQVEKTLRINLEAIQIAKEEQDRRQKA